MTAQLDRGLAALRKEFAAEIASGLIVHLGTTNCRTKNNKPDGPWSEHAWPNAVDVMLKRIKGTRTPTPEAKKVGDRVAAWMRAHPELWSEVFWQVAAHYDHPHGTATPRRNYDNKQIPPCAGGPDEPDPDPGDEEEMTPEQEAKLDKALALLTKLPNEIWQYPQPDNDPKVTSSFQYLIRGYAGIATLLKESMDDEAFETAVIANILASPDRFLDKLREALNE